MYLNCHVTSHEYRIQESCEFMDWSSLRYVTTLVILVTISIVIVMMQCF